MFSSYVAVPRFPRLSSQGRVALARNGHFLGSPLIADVVLLLFVDPDALELRSFPLYSQRDRDPNINTSLVDLDQPSPVLGDKIRNPIAETAARGYKESVLPHRSSFRLSEPQKGSGLSMGISRRDFVKGSIIAGAAITAVPTLLIRKSPAEWAKKTIVHPHVNNLRVVGITDPRMTKAKEVEQSGSARNNWFLRSRSGKTSTNWPAPWRRRTTPGTPGGGFSSSRRKNRGPIRSWRSRRITSPNSTRAAPCMAKVCHILVDVVGVKPSNIFIYDGIHGNNMSRETPFAGLPKGCKVVDQWGGISTPTAVPEPLVRGRWTIGMRQIPGGRFR